MHKRPISCAKLRKVPKPFSRVDRRLVRERYIEQLSHQDCALYLFLLSVADAQGLNSYSDLSICRRLSISQSALHKTQQELTQLDRVAYDTPTAIKDIFKHLAETLS